MLTVSLPRKTDMAALVRAVVRRLFTVYTVDIVQRSTAQQVPSPRADANLKLHRVTSKDDVVLRRAPVRRRRLRQAERALARGDLAYMAALDGEVVAWAWVSRVSHRDAWSGLTFRLKPSECYAYDLWSLPRYRELGAGAFVMAGMLRDLAEDTQLRCVYGYIDRENVGSQLLNRMVFGFSTVQTVKLAQVLNRWGWQVPGTDKPSVGPCSGRRPLHRRRSW